MRCLPIASHVHPMERRQQIVIARHMREYVLCVSRGELRDAHTMELTGLVEERDIDGIVDAISRYDNEIRFNGFRCNDWASRVRIVDAVVANTHIHTVIIDNMGRRSLDIASIGRMARSKPTVSLNFGGWDRDDTNSLIRSLVGSAVQELAISFRMDGTGWIERNTISALTDVVRQNQLRGFELVCLGFVGDTTEFISAIATDESLERLRIATGESYEVSRALARMLIESNPQNLVEIALDAPARPAGGLMGDPSNPRYWPGDAARLAEIVRRNITREPIMNALDTIELIQFIDGDGAFRAAVRSALTKS
jgi:hypothetical protein